MKRDDAAEDGQNSPLRGFRGIWYNASSNKPMAVLVERQRRQILRRHFGVAVVVLRAEKRNGKIHAHGG